LAASVILCGFAGWWLDGKYGTEPWFMVSGGFFGAVAGLTHFIRTALSMGKQKDVK
jgi:F0F1-type ATP synthase assembly protein I